MTPNNQNLLKTVFYIAIVISLAYLYIGSHELTHQTIASYYGCDGEIDYSISNGHFMPEKGCRAMLQETGKYNSYLESQSNVEAIGYQTFLFLYIIICILIHFWMFGVAIR